MTLEDAQRGVDKVRAMAGDNEGAHSEEDAFHMAVLASIAAGCENPAELAKIALQTEAIDYERWYA